VTVLGESNAYTPSVHGSKPVAEADWKKKEGGEPFGASDEKKRRRQIFGINWRLGRNRKNNKFLVRKSCRRDHVITAGVQTPKGREWSLTQ